MRRIECFKALFTFFLIASMLILGVGCEKGSKKAVVSQSVAQVDERFINNASLPSLFQNGLMAVSNDGKYGFLDENYQPVGKLEFDYCTRFSEDIAVVAKRKEATKELSYAYVDKNLNYITDFEFSDAEAFSEGLAAVKKDNESGYGLINKSGELIVDYQFSKIEPFSEGLAAVKKDNESGYGLINKSGELVVDYQFSEIKPFSEGLAAARLEERWGYINAEGEWICEPELYEAFPFNEGAAKVGTMINGKKHMGIMGKDGEMIFDFIEGNINVEFSNGLAIKQDGEKYGFIGLDKEWEIAPRFDAVETFSEGLAAAKKGDKWGYINTKGEWVISPRFESAQEFSYGVAIVYNFENGYESINMKGESIAKLDYKNEENSELMNFEGDYAVYSKYELDESILYDAVDAYGQLYGGHPKEYTFGIIDVNGKDLTGYTLKSKPYLFAQGYLASQNGKTLQMSYSGSPLAEGYFIVRP